MSLGCRGVPGLLLGPLRIPARGVLGRQPVPGGGQPRPPVRANGAMSTVLPALSSLRSAIRAT
jgi:hypothetical protein